MIAGMQGLGYQERLQKLGLNSLESRRDYNDLVFAYQVLNNDDMIDHTILESVVQVQNKTRSSKKQNVH